MAKQRQQQVMVLIIGLFHLALGIAVIMTRPKLIICTISILLNLTAIGYFSHKLVSRYDNVNNPETNWIHLSRKSLFEVIPTQEDKHNTIFLGASIIQYCEWNELLNQPDIINRGIAGDTTEDILSRLQEVIDRKPNQLFIMAGLNDIMKGKSHHSIAQNLTKILEQCLLGSPTSSIHLISILPIAKRLKNATQINAIIEKTNKLYQNIASRHKINFIDLNKALQGKDGFLYESYTIDGIHLTGQGYQTICNNLRPHIKAPAPDDTQKDKQLN